MGYVQKTALISADLNRHNSPKDKTDNAMWDELMSEIDHVVKNPRFINLKIAFTYSPGEG